EPTGPVRIGLRWAVGRGHGTEPAEMALDPRSPHRLHFRRHRRGDGADRLAVLLADLRLPGRVHPPDCAAFNLRLCPLLLYGHLDMADRPGGAEYRHGGRPGPGHRSAAHLHFV